MQASIWLIGDLNQNEWYMDIKFSQEKIKSGITIFLKKRTHKEPI